MDGSKAREMAQAADVDALVDGNGDASWQVDDSDYPPVPMSMEDFIRDSGDILLNLDADQFRTLRKRLVDVTTLPWIVHRPLGHERSEQIAFLKEHLGERFE